MPTVREGKEILLRIEFPHLLFMKFPKALPHLVNICLVLNGTKLISKAHATQSGEGSKPLNVISCHFHSCLISTVELHGKTRSIRKEQCGDTYRRQLLINLYYIHSSSMEMEMLRIEQRKGDIKI